MGVLLVVEVWFLYHNEVVVVGVESVDEEVGLARVGFVNIELYDSQMRGNVGGGCFSQRSDLHMCRV